jgi:hypothetical protein
MRGIRLVRGPWLLRSQNLLFPFVPAFVLGFLGLTCAKAGLRIQKLGRRTGILVTLGELRLHLLEDGRKFLSGGAGAQIGSGGISSFFVRGAGSAVEVALEKFAHLFDSLGILGVEVVGLARVFL